MANQCNCNWFMALISVVLFAVGIYFLVWGFVSQTTSGISWNFLDWNAVLFYLIGVLVLVFGKMAKWGSSVNCKLHGKQFSFFKKGFVFCRIAHSQAREDFFIISTQTANFYDQIFFNELIQIIKIFSSTTIFLSGEICREEISEQNQYRANEMSE